MGHRERTIIRYVLTTRKGQRDGLETTPQRALDSEAPR